MTLLDVEKIEVRYGHFLAVEDVSVKVDAGQMVAIVGANGAGKSSLLKAISGLVRPVRGSITFEGRSLSGHDPADIVRQGIVQVPEGRHVFPELSVYDNLVMGNYAGRSRAFAQALEEVYGYFPVLKARTRQLAGSLSGGEQQMLAVGRALVASPRLMLLDEPSLGLAPIVVKHIFSILRDIHESRGTAMLLVEQNVALALSLASYAYIIEAGRTVYEGLTERLQQDERIRQAYLGSVKSR